MNGEEISNRATDRQSTEVRLHDAASRMARQLVQVVAGVLYGFTSGKLAEAAIKPLAEVPKTVAAEAAGHTNWTLLFLLEACRLAHP